MKYFTFNFIKEIPLKFKNWNRLQFYKRNPFKIFCLQFYMKNPLKIYSTRLQFYKRNPFKFFSKKNQLWNLASKIPSRIDKLDTIFSKTLSTRVFLKIL